MCSGAGDGARCGIAKTFPVNARIDDWPYRGIRNRLSTGTEISGETGFVRGVCFCRRSANADIAGGGKVRGLARSVCASARTQTFPRYT